MGALYEDTFHRADQNPIAGNWVSGPGAMNDAQLLTFRGCGTVFSVENTLAYYNAATSAKQFARAEIANVSLGGSNGVCVNVQGPTDSSCYILVGGGGGTTDLAIYKVTDTGSLTFDLLGAVFGTFRSRDQLELQRIGNDLLAYQNGVLVATRTDSTWSGGFTGFYLEVNGSANDAFAEWWVGGDLDSPLFSGT